LLVAGGVMTFRNKIYVTLFAILELIVVLGVLVLAARAEQPRTMAEEKIVTAPNSVK
jgi:hypothetical protein